MRRWMLSAATLACIPLTPIPSRAQSSPAPAMAGPLQFPSPAVLNAGPFGKLEVTGIVSGIGLVQDNPAPNDKSGQADLSNAQLFIQKTTGVWQFFLEAGTYNIPALATPFLSTANTVTDFYGPLPVAYLKLAPTKNISVEIGQLPTLLGAEYTFDFQNMNIERGLLWNQENSINRGIQIDGNFSHFSTSLSWNDGFYSNRYSWLTGSLSYTFHSAHTLTFIAGGNYSQTRFRSLATPVQNNGSIYNLIYTYSKGNWTIQPYFQYGDVPANQKANIPQGAATRGGAILATYHFKHQFSLAGRGEYLSSSDRPGAINLLFGPGSSAWSITITPTFQDHDFFVRSEVAIVGAIDYTPGSGFGLSGMERSQSRAELELGFLF